MVTARSKTLSKTDLLTWRNAEIERAFQCGITVGHLAHIFDLTDRQIYGLKKKWEDTTLSFLSLKLLTPRSVCLSPYLHLSLTMVVADGEDSAGDVLGQRKLVEGVLLLRGWEDVEPEVEDDILLWRGRLPVTVTRPTAAVGAEHR